MAQTLVRLDSLRLSVFGPILGAFDPAELTRLALTALPWSHEARAPLSGRSWRRSGHTADNSHWSNRMD
jgi:hypothetical protein